ncbi:PAS domain-containing protein [uncultured Ferrovibrio sp.]|jgi:hypothetical protein|uniref:PAS domain-containing protein n=1 Tax=uncultured Ferrovibrio sp. TaxID=1576913 RepID=UPI00262DEDA8|nr:PAS domain-containing protein [uncultured Ferrovibrio sp.]
MSDAAAQPWQDDRRIADFLNYWRSKRPAAGRLPPKPAIDPVELGAGMLPILALIEPIDGGARFRYRLSGTRMNADAGLDLTGRYVDELNPNRDYARYLTGLYRMTMQHRLPVYSETRYRARSGRMGTTRRLLCPLAKDGVSVDTIVCAQVLEPDDQRFIEAPTLTYAASFEPVCVFVIAD